MTVLIVSGIGVVLAVFALGYVRGVNARKIELLANRQRQWAKVFREL